MSDKKLVILGAGSVGGHIASNPEIYGIEGRIAGFLDDDPSKIGQIIQGVKVIDTIDWILDKEDYDVIIGIAFPKVKKKVIERISVNKHLKFPTLTARNSWISNYCEIGKGSIIYPGCSINYNAEIGDFVVINMNCALGHHARIGDYSNLAPTVSFGGHTTVGDLVDIGIGASTIQNVNIGSGAIIGGQAMLIHDVPENSVVVGIPGRVKE